MPYFTKKGTGKDKGKTCVFKKEDKTKVGCTDGPIQKYMAALHMNESDFEWVKGPVTVKLGDIAENIGDYLSVGDTIHVSGDFTLNDYDEILEINHSAEIIGITSTPEEKDSLRVDFGVKMLQIPEWEANFSSGEVDLGEPFGVMSDYELLITLPTPKNMNESDEWEWVKEVDVDLVDGEIYDIKTSNGYYWVPEKFIGREWDDEYDVEMYKFKDLNGRGSGGRSVPYIKELMSKGHIRPYDPNWSIKDEITFSDNLEDALKGNFVVYFKDGVQLDQTLKIQDKLFEMGFSFYTKGPNEYITNEDSPGQIQFFECINWDTSNPRYKSMPSNQRDLKKILLSKVRDDETRWRPEPNPRLDEQELFQIVVDHDAIVINGDKYIGGDITESEDDSFKWIEDVSSDFNATHLRYGQKFKNKWGKWVRTIMFIGHSDPVVSYEKPLTILTFKIIDDPSGYIPYPGLPKDHENNTEIIYTPLEFDKHVKNGSIQPMFDSVDFKLKESEDLDWIRQQEPEKKLKKTKSYVVDVSYLRPTPMRYSHDPSLTRQDILDRFEELGYDVNSIPVDEAKYFYIEPCTDCGEWDGPTWIEKEYWVDYNIEYMTDPSYGGKYQMIDIDELMFLLDNNLISESGDDTFKWIEEIPGEEGWGETYRYFEVSVCHSSIYDDDIGEDECIEGYSYFFKIPANIVPEIWDYEAEDQYYAGMDEGHDVIKWAIENNIINDNEVDTIDFVTEHTKNIWCIAWGKYNDKKECSEFINESGDFGWIDEIKPELTQESFISVIEDHPWFSVDLDGSYVEVDISDEFIEDIGDLDGSGLITIDFRGTESLSDVLKQIKSEFTWSPDEARRLQGYSGLVRLIIAMDELARLLEPLVGRDNVRYYSHYLTQNNRNIVSEVAGISFESRKWSEIIENEIKNNPNETERLIIDGYDHPEAFNSFPIDYIIIDFYDKITGYSQDYSGYDKDGNYIVLLYIQPQLISGHGGFSLRSALNHEMKHAWQDYNRLSKGLPSIDQTKESEELYTKDFIKMLSDQNVRGPIKEILKYHYYLSKLETSPYLENVYDGDNSYERLVREIVSKDFNQFKERFDLEVNWHLMNTMYDIPFLQKFKSSLDFIDYSAEELRSRALKMIKKINKMRYIHGKSH